MPRAGVAIAHALVAVSFPWESVGGLVDVPDWVLALSPFHHVAFVPAEPVAVTSTLVRRPRRD